MSGLIPDRIAILKEKLNIWSDRGLEKGGLPGDQWVVSNGQISKWVGKDPAIFSNDTVEKFLTFYGINKEWWRTGEGEIFNKKGTYVKTPTDNNQKHIMEPDQFFDTLKTVVEGKTEYLLVPRGVLKDNYRLVSLEQYEKDMAQLEKDKQQIEKDRVHMDALIKKADEAIAGKDQAIAALNRLIAKLEGSPVQPQQSNQ